LEKKSEALILEAIEESYTTKSAKPRVLYSFAEKIVDDLIKYMRELDCVVDLEATGSFRRKNPTIGDLDIPVSTTNQKQALDHFLAYPKILKVLVAGKKEDECFIKK